MRTNFDIQTPMKQKSVENAIREWLQANSFVEHKKGNETYMRTGSSLTHWYCFQYAVDKGLVHIEAWLDSTREVALENDGPEGIWGIKDGYRKILYPFLDYLRGEQSTPEMQLAADTGSIGTVTADASGQATATQETPDFAATARKSHNGQAIAGFVIGIIAFVIDIFSFFGLPIMAGGLPVIIGLGLSISGLKSEKKTLAILGTVFCGIAGALLILSLVITLTAGRR